MTEPLDLLPPDATPSRVTPLADRVRARTLDEFVGQESIVGPGTLLRATLEAGEITQSMILWGPPGCGKTTLARLILGLRDVMDEPRLLEPEWQRKKVLPALREFYDELWVYGLPQICDPLEGISLPTSVRKKMVYTGYLHREVPTHGAPPRLPEMVNRPFLLVTTGGGGDGEGLVEWVLRAYEHDPLLPYPALLVLGPFMQAERQAEFMDRAARLKRVDAITFHGQLETLVARAAGVVAMGGYNTFCEVVSL
ncbi:MAG: AAA family ATPase, partial [Candidatus Latescibacteria bacterium]|nr:AAA family ATPase [Candidatus Latescibacterota bacterium]